MPFLGRKSHQIEGFEREKGDLILKKIVKKAFVLTIPVMLGYVSVGIAFGLLFQSTEFHMGWGFLMSLFIYAGSMQFIAIELFQDYIGFLQIAILTFFVNIRHMFYGFSFIDKFNQMKGKKGYMIFSLTDETYSLLCSLKVENTKESHLLFFLIAALNQFYWLLGTVIGVLAGAMITFDTTGINFAMTALFVVIFIEQWKSATNHLPALIGIGASLVTMMVFGADNMILPTMALILMVLTLMRKKISPKEGVTKE